MHLAVLHYHLNRGGVTQVIRNHLRALSAAGSDCVERVVLLYGGRREAWPETFSWPGRQYELHLVPLESLDYDELRPPRRADSRELARQVQTALAARGLPAADTLLHVHNHALGKNAALPDAVAQLAAAGYRLLLQVHDFAEDFRPQNYRHLADAVATRDAAELAGRLYPQASHVHYAVLNVRDRRILERVVADARRVHLLYNPVEGPGTLPDRQPSREKMARLFDVPEDRPLVVYPVRAIRRKNVGEMLLWSAVRQREAVFAVTLRPLNPAERVGYDRWVSLAEMAGLACRFATGENHGLTFAENLAASDAMLTTSVAEGFGMVFLEAPSCGRPLVGRDLPEITEDFKRHDVRSPWLAAGVSVPPDLVDTRAVAAGLADAYVEVQQAYGRQTEWASAAERARRLVDSRPLDFAMLPPPLQAELIQRASDDHQVRNALEEANPHRFLLPDREESSVANLLAHNAAVIEEQFGLRASGERLSSLYRRILATEPGPLFPLSGGEALVDAFLDLGRLHPLRLEK